MRVSRSQSDSRNEPVDVCVTRGRQALIAEHGLRRMDWGIPALFTRAMAATMTNAAHELEDEPDGETRKSGEVTQMGDQRKKQWWNEVSVRAGGDVFSGITIGDNATGVAVGKNINQSVANLLGPSSPDDRQVVEKSLADFMSAYEQVRSELDPSKVAIADYQISQLKSELEKSGPDRPPSGDIIAQAGNWLLDNVPGISQAITSLFATPAVGRIVGKAGESAVTFLRSRLGRQASPGN